MRIHQIALCLSILSSCKNESLKNDNSFNELENNHIVRINEVLYIDTITLIPYYQWNVDTSLVSESIPRFSCIKNDKKECVTSVDISTFINLGTLWIDKNNWYYIHDQWGNREVKAIPWNSFIGTLCFFNNSKYYISNGQLNYFGYRTNNYLDTEINIKDQDLFYVLNTRNDIDMRKGINAYAIFNEEILFHGEAIDLSIIDSSLIEYLMFLKKNKIFSEKYCIRCEDDVSEN